MNDIQYRYAQSVGAGTVAFGPQAAGGFQLADGTELAHWVCVMNEGAGEGEEVVRGKGWAEVEESERV